MATYGFSEEDAKRIGKSVRLTERYVGKGPLSGPSTERGGIGVRLTVAKAGTAFTYDSTATVTMFRGDFGSVVSAITMVGWNQFVPMVTHTAVTNPYVAFGHNGNGWIAVAAERHTHCSFLGDKYTPYITNYTTTTAYAQALSHDSSGCLKWAGTNVSVINGVTLSTAGLKFSFIELHVNATATTTTQNITVTTCA